MIELGLKVFNKRVEIRELTDGNRGEYATRPRWVADGLRVYMARERICSLKGRAHAINAVLLSECQARHIPVSTLVDTHRTSARKDRRPAWLKDAHAKTPRLL